MGKRYVLFEWQQKTNKGLTTRQRVIEKNRLLFFIVNELACAIIKQISKSEVIGGESA